LKSYKREASSSSLLLGISVKAEVEKGFARTAFDRESVDPEAQINLVNRTIRSFIIIKKKKKV